MKIFQNNQSIIDFFTDIDLESKEYYVIKKSLIGEIKFRNEKIFIDENNTVNAYLNCKHEAVVLIDDKPKKIILPNGSLFSFDDDNKLICYYYNISSNNYFKGLMDNIPDDFIYDCEILKIKPIKQKIIKYIGFNKEKSIHQWLSNESPHNIIFKGVAHKNLEELFKYLPKTICNIYELPVLSKTILYKPFSSNLIPKRHSPYSKIKRELSLALVQKFLFIKIKQHPNLSDKLLQTDGYELYFDISNKKRKSSSDFFWGAYMDNGELLGHNNLGKLWMKIRDKIRDKAK